MEHGRSRIDALVGTIPWDRAERHVRGRHEHTVPRGVHKVTWYDGGVTIGRQRYCTRCGDGCSQTTPSRGEVVIDENHEKLSDPHTTRHGDSLAYLGQ